MSNQGEFSSLAANGVTSLSTTTNTVDYPTDGQAGRPKAAKRFSSIRRSCPSGGIVDFIADFAQDTLDLSELLASLGDSQPVTDAAPESVNPTTDASAGSGAGETFVDVAALTGISTAIAILYDESQHSQTANVT